ncbi:MAG: hypothetical protein ACK4WD_11405 [Flavobacteriales bacterium]|jgi:hypothetical protein
MIKRILTVATCLILKSAVLKAQSIPDSNLQWHDKLTFEDYKTSPISSNNFKMVLLGRGQKHLIQTNDSTFVEIFGDSTTFLWRDFKQTTKHADLRMDQGDYFLFTLIYFGGGDINKEGFIYSFDAVCGDWVYVTQKVRKRKNKLVARQKLLFKLIRD